MSLNLAGDADTFPDCGNTLSIQYKDRKWEIDLNSHATTAARDAATLAAELQAALNLSRLPVGLSLRTAPGADAVVCPLSMLVACPSYVTTTFQGMSWVPLLEGGGPDDPPPARTRMEKSPSVLPFAPDSNLETRNNESSRINGAVPLHPGSPLKVIVPEEDMSILAQCGGSTASPSERWGRPLTAPPGDRTRGVPRQRAGRREGLGRPMSATPSDKSFGMRRVRPGKREGFGRPVSAVPSDHSGSCSPAWRLSSPGGFGCENYCKIDERGIRDDLCFGRRPVAAPTNPIASSRQASSPLSGSVILYDRSGEQTDAQRSGPPWERVVASRQVSCESLVQTGANCGDTERWGRREAEIGDEEVSSKAEAGSRRGTKVDANYRPKFLRHAWL